MKVSIPGLLTRDNYHVPADLKGSLMQSIGFSDQSRQMMSNHTVSDLSGNRDSQAISSQVIGPHIQNKETVRPGIVLFIDLLKISVLLQRFAKNHKSSHKVEKTTWRCGPAFITYIDLWSSWKRLSTLSSSCCENLTSACSAHSLTETMNFRSLSGLRLECHLTLMHSDTSFTQNMIKHHYKYKGLSSKCQEKVDFLLFPQWINRASSLKTRKTPQEDEETSVDKFISFGINTVDKFNLISILFFFFWRAKQAHMACFFLFLYFLSKTVILLKNEPF